MTDNLSMTNKTICLNMIVKNEEHIIESTLVNILQNIQIDYWVISDTGSTDNTINIIRNFFSENNILGELFQDEWKDFGHNRTKALEHAYNKTDYLFIFDADDLIEGKIILPSPFDKDIYRLQFGNPVTFHRPILISNQMKWEYKGVLHEYLSNIDTIKGDIIHSGDFFIHPRTMGNRSKNPNKYLDDAHLLEKGYEEENVDMWLKYRYSYYCAQSYQNIGNMEKAIEWYENTLTLDTSPQYKYCACIYAGDCYHKLKKYTESIKLWGKSYSYDNERIEGVVRIMDYYYNNGLHFMVSALYNKFKHIRIGNIQVHNKIFVDFTKYIEFHYFGSISGCYSGEHKSAYEACKYLLLHNWKFTENTIFNLQFYITYFKRDTDKNKLVSFFINYIQNTHNQLADRESAWKLVKDIIKDEYIDVYDVLETCITSR